MLVHIPGQALSGRRVHPCFLSLSHGLGFGLKVGAGVARWTTGVSLCHLESQLRDLGPKRWWSCHVNPNRIVGLKCIHFYFVRHYYFGFLIVNPILNNAGGQQMRPEGRAGHCSHQEQLSRH